MTLSEFANKIISECAQKAADSGYTLPPITLLLDLKGKKRLGTCLFKQPGPIIRLSRAHYAAMGEVYANTVAHEYAHALDFWQWPLSATHMRVQPRRWRTHGAHWSRIMRVIGYDPHRVADEAEMALCANVAPVRRTRRYLYTCVGCSKEFWLSSPRHTRVQANKTSFGCADCKARGKSFAARKLTYQGKEELR